MAAEEAQTALLQAQQQAAARVSEEVRKCREATEVAEAKASRAHAAEAEASFLDAKCKRLETEKVGICMRVHMGSCVGQWEI